MSSTLMAMGVAGLAAGGLVITLGVASLLSGGIHFLVRPRLRILKSKHAHGFAFGVTWNSAREPANFDQVRLSLFNAFGTPQKIEIWRSFAGFDANSARDVDMGHELERMMKARCLEKAQIQIEVGSSKDGVFYQFDMPAHKFANLRAKATREVSEFAENVESIQAKPVYTVPKRSFIADPLPPSDNKVLKLATNPAFAAEMAAHASGAGGENASAQENFPVTKVWIDPGCIVCDACEGIYPEVFEVTDSTCIIRPDAPLHDGLKIEEAAEACPVEVIKFEKV